MTSLASYDAGTTNTRSDSLPCSDPRFLCVATLADAYVVNSLIFGSIYGPPTLLHRCPDCEENANKERKFVIYKSCLISPLSIVLSFFVCLAGLFISFSFPPRSVYRLSVLSELCMINLTS